MASFGLASADATAGAPETELLRCWHPARTAAETAKINTIGDFMMTSQSCFPRYSWSYPRRQLSNVFVLRVLSDSRLQRAVSWTKRLPGPPCQLPNSCHAFRARRRSSGERRWEAYRRLIRRAPSLTCHSERSRLTVLFPFALAKGLPAQRDLCTITHDLCA
jgi:hypothetical protein